MPCIRPVLVSSLWMILAAAAGAQTYHVDPLNGVDDATSNGSPANPYRSITFALTQQTGPSIHLKLAKGTYSQATGEVFPIFLAGTVTIEGTGPGWSSQESCGARISYPANPVLTSVFQVVGGTVALQRFKIETGHRGIWVQGFDDLRCEELDVTAYRAIDFDGGGTPSGAALVRRCRLRVAASALPLASAALRVSWNSVQGNPLNFEVVQCDVSAGSQARRAADLVGGPFGFVITFASSVLHASQAGVVAFGNLTVNVNNCTLWGNGTGLPGEGGLVSAGGPSVVFNGFNNLFNANGANQDVFPGATTQGTGVFANLFNNLMQQNAGGGTTLPVFGPAYLADPANGDFHLLPAPFGNPNASRAIGMGLPSSQNEDFDGGRRTGLDGIVDLGADEYEPHWISVQPPFRIGAQSTVAMIGNGNVSEGTMLFADVAPNASVPHPAGFLLPNPTFLPPAFVVPANHRVTYSATLPADFSLVGAQIVLQALYLDTTTNTYSVSNVLAAPVRQ